MGSPSDESGRFPDEGQHKVTIGHSFWLGQKPVSQALWCAVMDCGVSCPSDDVAMTKISWDDCREFIDRINHEISCSCVGCFRFPTEAEWEYACRAGSVEPFSGAYRKDGGSVGESLIGCCSENSWGFVDMHGNVSEWCSDCYVSSTTSQCDNQGQEKKCYEEVAVVRVSVIAVRRVDCMIFLMRAEKVMDSDWRAMAA